MRIITLLYSLLLLYIIAALIFWGISLNKQSNMIFRNEVALLKKNIDSTRQKDRYSTEYDALEQKANLREHQYLGEGATFFIVILIGAAVVYSSIRSNHKLSQQQKNFILSITHELKSPIAAIKLNLETLTKRELDKSKQQMLLERSIKETNRLNDLCSNLLIASQMEHKDFKSSEENIDLSELADNCITEAQHRNPKHLFQSDIEPGCFVLGDKLLLQLLINNLLENAAKYSATGSEIKTTLQRNDENIIIAIADNGIGIPNEEKKKIFQKFYRVGNEDTRATKGTGLGLYLIEKIIRKHKGDIQVLDNKPAGSIFEVTLNAG
jgi:signal transduction histidine kinase